LVANALKEGVSVRVNDDELGDMESEDGHCYTVKSVQSLVINYKADQQIPSYQITLAEKIISNPINRIENEIGNIAENVQNNGSQNTVNRRNGIRNSRSLRALRDKIFDTDGYFDPENIRPNSIETQYLPVGAKSRDFTTNKISMKAYKEGDIFKVSLSTGYINHRALWWGGGDEAPADVDKFTWGINDAVVKELSENDKDYYIYVKAERNSQLAEWFVSTDKRQYDFDKDYYYLLLGVIYPVQEDRRDISLVNGMAYISGGAIYGDVIKSINYVDDDSNEGSMYDLNNGKFRLGNSKSGMDFGVSQQDQLTIAGAINALAAVLGGFTIDNEKIQSIAKTEDSPNIILNGTDGSGQLAAGNIIWDAIGNLLISGKFESNQDGNRIIIDPTTRNFQMLDGEGKNIFELSFATEIHGGIQYVIPKMVMNHWVGGEIVSWCELNGYGMRFFDNYGNQSYMYPTDVGGLNVANESWGFGFGWDELNNCLHLSATNIPKSSSGLLPGRIYRDGNTLKIVT
jgi:hypothetical protein